MLKLEEISEFYRIGLIIGYFEKSDIIEWADSMLSKTENSNIHLIDLSLGKDLDLNEFSYHLSEVSCNNKYDISTKMLITKIVEDLKNDDINIQRASNLLNRLSVISELPEDDKDWLICFDDDLEAVRDGLFGDLDILKNDMITYFSKYGEYNNLI